MSSEAQQYWDAKSSVQSFSHPMNFEWLADVPKDARILDYGCGYGRTLAELGEAGWRNAVGVDFSAGMIERGLREHPELDLRRVSGLPIDEPDCAFDVAVLFAVLTTIADDTVQDAVMAELKRLLKPGGLLLVSDYPLQTDDRYLARYAAGEARHGVYGVWTREDGGVFRHHPAQRLEQLLAPFEALASRELATTTLSGAPAVAVQYLARSPPP
jgi:SAM-dependent methyltransferase